MRAPCSFTVSLPSFNSLIDSGVEKAEKSLEVETVIIYRFLLALGTWGNGVVVPSPARGETSVERAPDP